MQITESESEQVMSTQSQLMRHSGLGLSECVCICVVHVHDPSLASKKAFCTKKTHDSCCPVPVKIGLDDLQTRVPAVHLGNISLASWIVEAVEALL